MECDKNMGFLNGKFQAVVPVEWYRHIDNARLKPEPFHVEPVDSCLNRDWTAFLSSMYVKKCRFGTRPVRKLKIDKQHSRMVLHRDSYNGQWASSLILKKNTTLYYQVVNSTIHWLQGLVDCFDLICLLLCRSY